MFDRSSVDSPGRQGQRRRRRSSETRAYLRPQLTPLLRGSKRKQKTPCRLPEVSAGSEAQLEPQVPLSSPAVISPATPGSPTSGALGSSTSGPDTPSFTPCEPLRSTVMLNSSDTTRTADELRADERAPAMYHSVSIAAQLRDEAVPPASHNHIVFGALCTPPVDLSLHQSSSAPHVLRYRLPKSVFPTSSGLQSPITPGGELARSGRLFSAADNVTGSIPDKQVDVDLSISPYRDSKTASLSTVSETGGVPTGDVLIPGEKSCYEEDSSSIAADAGTGRCFDARSSEEVKSLHSSYPMQSISVADRYPPEPPASCLPQPEKKASCVLNERPSCPPKPQHQKTVEERTEAEDRSSGQRMASSQPRSTSRRRFSAGKAGSAGWRRWCCLQATASATEAASAAAPTHRRTKQRFSGRVCLPDRYHIRCGVRGWVSCSVRSRHPAGSAGRLVARLLSGKTRAHYTHSAAWISAGTCHSFNSLFWRH